jgi:hypothetical protein
MHVVILPPFRPPSGVGRCAAGGVAAMYFVKAKLVKLLPIMYCVMVEPFKLLPIMYYVMVESLKLLLIMY